MFENLDLVQAKQSWGYYWTWLLSAFGCFYLNFVQTFVRLLLAPEQGYALAQTVHLNWFFPKEKLVCVCTNTAPEQGSGSTVCANPCTWTSEQGSDKEGMLAKLRFAKKRAKVARRGQRLQSLCKGYAPACTWTRFRLQARRRRGPLGFRRRRGYLYSRRRRGHLCSCTNKVRATKVRTFRFSPQARVFILST